METTLHRQLKDYFCQPGSQIEVKLGRYRIDVVNGQKLVEIQRSGLSAIRDKINRLLKDGFEVDVVKPLVHRKRLVKLSRKNGREVDRRWSPRKATPLDIFDELIYFTRVFPHPNLRLLVPLVSIEEVRYPGHGKRRRRRAGDFQVKDRRIIEVLETHEYETVHDLHRLLPSGLPKRFDTADLARSLEIPRYQAQRIAYVMRKTGAAIQTGKRGNAIECRLTTKRESKAALAKKKPKRRACLETELTKQAQKAARQSAGPPKAKKRASSAA
jgi:hypothetical protein